MRIAFTLVLAVLAWLESSTTSLAASYTYEVFRFPDAIGTFANGIDDEGNISGSLLMPSPGITQRGFYRPVGGDFEFVDVPGRPETVPLGLNNLGQIVGDTLDPTGRERRGFVREPNGVFQEFTITGSSGGFQVNDINEVGQIIGGRSANSDVSDTFLRESDGSFRFFEVPGVENGISYGINNHGIATGNNGDLAFILDTSDGSFEVIEYPGATQTQFFGINDLGEIAGLWYSPTEGHHGFVRSPAGVYQELAPPGGGFPTPWGINNLGQVVGHYDIPGDSVRYGFLATPVPEPSTLTILSICCGVALAFSNRRTPRG